MSLVKGIGILGFGVIAWAGTAMGEIRPEKVHVANARKNDFYIKDGLVTGGDQAIDDVVIRDIRRAVNPAGFERLVIDLEGNKRGESTAIQRPPYYQVAVTPDEKRLVVTMWGRPKLAFDSRKVVADFKKSSVVQSLSLLPTLEENSWSFVVELKGEHPVEIFELSNPVRVIVDIRNRK